MAPTTPQQASRFVQDVLDFDGGVSDTKPEARPSRESTASGIPEAQARRSAAVLALRWAHVAVFFAIGMCLLYVLFSAATGQRTALTWFSTVTVALEAAVLIATRGHCPLSALSERLGDDSGPVTRLFFPRWFMPWVTPTFVALATVGVAFVVLQR